METVEFELPLDAAKRFVSLSSTDKNQLYDLVTSWLNSPNTTEKKRIESKFRWPTLGVSTGNKCIISCNNYILNTIKIKYPKTGIAASGSRGIANVCAFPLIFYIRSYYLNFKNAVRNRLPLIVQTIPLTFMSSSFILYATPNGS